MANPSLPGEILVEIFSRLPRKPVGKCKCLSKFWLSFLSTPYFQNLWLSHNRKMILITPSHSLFLVTPKVDNNAVSRKLELPGTWTQVIGSCNGLVLLANKDGELHLVNPVTCSIVKIPVFVLPAFGKSETSGKSHGFGYDSSSNDYKIVTLSQYNDIKNTFVDVYSVKKDVWKRIECVNFFVFAYRVNLNVTGVFISGALHWQALNTNDDFVIAAFDLANEVFSEISIPDRMLNVVSKRLLVCGGCLSGISLMVSVNCGVVDGRIVWTMKEYGSLESRTQFNIPEDIDWPLCFVGEERLVFSTFGGGGVFVYDVKEGRVKEFIVDGVPAHCKDMDNFVTNLAQLG